MTISRFPTVLFISLLIALPIAVAGCAQAAEKAVEEGTGVDVETEKSGVLKKVDTSDVPKELQYSGAKATEKVKVKNPQGDGEGIQLNLETSDSAEKVEAYYDEKVADEGWEEQIKLEEDVTAYTLIKGESWATVTLEEKDGKTKITVLYLKDLGITDPGPGSP
ncbi:MAG: hypothetical protein ACE5E0_05380 [Terriglobia bacterium]